MKDFREQIFSKNAADTVTAAIYTDCDGIVSGIGRAVKKAEELGLKMTYSVSEGSEVFSGDLLMEFSGNPVQICIAEDVLMAEVSKTSGVATAAKAFSRKANGRAKVVCGSWKKMPAEIKGQLRQAVLTGGVAARISDEPMIYLDKNYVSIFGGVQKALMAVADIADRKKVIQVKGRYENGDVAREALTALYSGADIIYVDTGDVKSLKAVREKLDSALCELKAGGEDRSISIAFGGSVLLEQLDDIIEAGADIIGVGRAIIDAPLMDLRLEVRDVQAARYQHSDYSLFNKHELTIQGIRLDNANLNELSDAVADTIGASREDVLVIDVRDNFVCLDVLCSHLDPENFVSKEESLLKRISEIKGVCLDKSASVVSNGMLGWIAGDDESLSQARIEMSLSKAFAEQIKQNIAKRAIVFPTGAEVEAGEIEDTNTPFIVGKLREAGFTVDTGEVLKDDLRSFSARLKKAAEMGYGLCITTGGVGAENKDYSVEAIQLMDRNAATPYIAKFRSGHGRHSKDGIRIGVGQEGVTTYVALPGPHDEVQLCIDAVISGFTAGNSKEAIAASVAELLRSRLREKLTGKHDK